jgi:hypothetical protein
MSAVVRTDEWPRRAETFAKSSQQEARVAVRLAGREGAPPSGEGGGLNSALVFLSMSPSVSSAGLAVPY